MRPFITQQRQACARATDCSYRDTCNAGQCEPTACDAQTFVFDPQGQTYAKVHVAGDFNNWQPTPLIKCESGIWETAIDCKPAGRYRYKFLIDGNQWTEDSSHALKEDDGFGGFNSILLLA